MRRQKYFQKTSSSTPAPLCSHLEKYISLLQRHLNLSAHLSVLMNMFAPILVLIDQCLFTDTGIIAKNPHLPRTLKIFHLLFKQYCCSLTDFTFPINMHMGLLFSIFVHRLLKDSAVLLGCLKIWLEKTGRFNC